MLYLKIQKISFINYLIPLIIKILNENSYVVLIFPEKKYYINQENIKKIEFGKKNINRLYTELLIENDNLLFSIGSHMLCHSKKWTEKLFSVKEEDIFIFYRLIEEFCNKKDIKKKDKDDYKKNI